MSEIGGYTTGNGALAAFAPPHDPTRSTVRGRLVACLSRTHDWASSLLGVDDQGSASLCVA